LIKYFEEKIMAENKKIDNLRESLLEDFEKKRVLLSFGDYLDLVEQNPKSHTRNAPAYIRDVFESYGKEKIGTWKGNPVYKFGLFEKVFESRGISLVGQERAQSQVFDLLTNAVGEGLSNKMILLHGPNGSSKSTFLSAVMKGVEEYSNSAEGAQYSFSWIFPLERKLQGGLGLGRGVPEGSSRFDLKESYAGLSEELIAAKVHCEFHDHPLLLIPVEYRRKIIREFLKTDSDEFLKDNLLISEGSLCPKCRSIFNELLTSFKGDIGSLKEIVVGL
jgi:hypothetical protein